MEQQNYITICHDYDTPPKEFIKLKQELVLKNYTILDDDVLDIDNNRKINVQAYYQLKKRSPNNPYIFFLHSKMVEKKLEEITDSDVILFYNVNDGNMSQLMFFYLTLSWQLVKKIYIWTPLNKKLPFYNEIFSLEIPIINKDLDKIIPPIKGNPYKEEVKNLVIEERKSIPISIEKPPTEERKIKLTKKKLIKPTIKKNKDEEDALFDL